MSSATATSTAPCPECGQIVPAEPAVHGGGLITDCPRHGRIRLDPRRPPPPAPPSPSPSGAVPISACVGRPIRCPEPGCTQVIIPRPATATMGPELAKSSVLASHYFEVACPRHGRKLHREGVLVEPVGDAPPPVPAVRIVRCPEPGCGRPCVVLPSRGSGALHRGSGDWVKLDGCPYHGPKLYPIGMPFVDVPADEMPAEVPTSTPPYARGARP
jgi:hypothetical protein